MTYSEGSESSDVTENTRTGGERLRNWRNQKGWTQAEFASRLDPKVDQPTVARWESGARRIPPGLWTVLACWDAGESDGFSDEEKSDEPELNENWEIEEFREQASRFDKHLLEAYWIAGTIEGGRAEDDLRWHLYEAIYLVDEIVGWRGDLRHRAAIVPPEYSRRR